MALINARGQEVARPSLARIKEQPALATAYNLKLGPILVNLGAGFGTEFIDNVNLASDSGTGPKPESDLTLKGNLNLAAQWQVTKLNTLRLSMGVTYTKYLEHPELDTRGLSLSPDSAISFNIYTGDFRINLHNQFSLQQDPVSEGSVSNVAFLTRFTNTIGFSVLWDLNDVLISLGYDHTNLITLGAASTGSTNQTTDVSFLDRQTDEISSSAFFHVAANVGAGLEATAYSTRFTNDSQRDATGFSIGPFFEVQLSRYTKFSASFGYQARFSQNQSDVSQSFVDNPFVTIQDQLNAGTEKSGNTGALYGNLTIAHRLNRWYVDSLSIGRQNQIGLLSDQSLINYVNYRATAQLFPTAVVTATFFVNDVHQSGGFVAADYVQAGASLSMIFVVTKKMTVSPSYQYTQKFAGDETASYRQNRLGVTFSYRF